jgi:hypothetical protein
VTARTLAQRRLALAGWAAVVEPDRDTLHAAAWRERVAVDATLQAAIAAARADFDRWLDGATDEAHL